MFEFKDDAYGRTVHVTTDAEMFSELLQTFIAFALACGFHPSTIAKGIAAECRKQHSEVIHEQQEDSVKRTC